VQGGLLSVPVRPAEETAAPSIELAPPADKAAAKKAGIPAAA